MTFEQFLLIISTILPILYVFSFWFYTIQLKEYRWDRFREYILTPQGKSAIFNFWFFVELPLLIGSFSIYFDAGLEFIIAPVIFYFLIFFNIFVIGKILRGRIIKPKITGRLLITVLFFLIGASIDAYYIIFGGYWTSYYWYIMFCLLFAPLIVFFYILLTLPLVNYLKNKKIKKAILKSNKVEGPIKIAITGSYGKSSVKEFLSSILQQDGELLKTPENINTELGVSAIVLNKLKNKYKYFIAEIGAYRIGEISILGKIVNHKYGFLTAIGNQHIGLFGNQKNIVKSKSEIVESVFKNNGILYINIDNKEIGKASFPKKLNIVKYGKSKKADAKYKILEEKNGKTEFEFIYNLPLTPILDNKGEQKVIKTKFKIDMIGEHNIINLTGVIACCYDLGLKTTEIKKYLKNLSGSKSSKTIIKNKKNILIDDTYNLSVAGLKSGIELFKNYKNYKKILILDDILELGKESEKIHYEIAKKIAEKKQVDKILFAGVNYKKSFIDGLIKGGFKKENVILDLNKITEKTIFLFEGKKSKAYLNNFNK